MGQVFGEARELGEAVFQAREHLVECLAERLQLTDVFKLIEAQVQVLHVNRGGARCQLTHRAQAALADQPTEPKGE